MAELRMGGLRRVPGEPRLGICPEGKVDERGQVVTVWAWRLEPVAILNFAEFREARHSLIGDGYGRRRPPQMGDISGRRNLWIGIEAKRTASRFAADQDRQREYGDLFWRRDF